jgi:methionine biosynthesis protein MetW
MGYEEKRIYARKDDVQKFRPRSAWEMCINLIEPGKTVLDVGCATGYLSQELRKKGCKTIGIEIAEKAAEEAKKHCDNVFTGNAETIDLPYKEYFDVILFADVLEHLRNPLEVLNRFKNCLKKDGYIVISIPNIANWFVRLFLLFGRFNYSAKGCAILDPGHLRFFTLDSVRDMLKKAGFRIVYLDITTNVRGSERLQLLKSFLRFFKGLFAVQFIIKAEKQN